ncbi:MAG: arginase family protein [Bacteroidaceae bacterium]|nr:arginase family protein [Bacteroidaceae bacterium]
MPLVFNFTHVYEAYAFMQDEAFVWLDCTQIQGSDCYCDVETERTLKEMMVGLPLHAVHWIDSGDYHYMSKLWTDQIKEPFDLVVLDHHPDMQQPMFGELLSCGSWVRAVLEQNTYLQQVLLIGVDDKLLGETTGFGDRVRVVTESELKQTSLESIISRINFTLPVYLSVDKDVMNPNECTTNWDQGLMNWKQLTAIVHRLMEGNILGVDICGEEPKILTECCYNQDVKINQKFNESVYNLIISDLR